MKWNINKIGEPVTNAQLSKLYGGTDLISTAVCTVKGPRMCDWWDMTTGFDEDDFLDPTTPIATEIEDLGTPL